MTTARIAEIIAGVDPNARHYDATAAAQAGESFTVWMEYERIVLHADDDPAEFGWRFEVDRYTTEENDPIAELLEAALYAAEDVVCAPRRVLYDIDTGYIRHVFDCEGY